MRSAWDDEDDFDDAWETRMSAYDEDDDFCLYPENCCMAYTTHTADECYTPEDAEWDMMEMN